MVTMDDLTKLSGPELADKLESVNVRVDILEPNAWTGANVFNEACRRLRETLATLDAVRALADEWELLLNGVEHGPAWAPIVRIREALNGKR